MMQNAAHEGAASELQIGDLDTHLPSTSATAPQIDVLEIWASQLIALSALYAEVRLDLIAAVDRAWAAAEDAGLVDRYGPDEIQEAMALAFGSVRC